MKLLLSAKNTPLFLYSSNEIKRKIWWAVLVLGGGFAILWTVQSELFHRTFSLCPPFKV